MIAYEISLRYVIRDKIQSEKKFGPRHIQSETKSENFFIGKKILSKKKKISDFVLD